MEESGTELFNLVVERRMFLDLRNSSWENVHKHLEKVSSEGGRETTMPLSDICSTDDDDLVQRIVIWIRDQISKHGVKVTIGIDEVTFSW